jgi:hypothetical protein
MAKAILVMDMPECCADCQLADDDPSGLYCMFADDCYDGSDSSEDRASFCPLRELPEKKEELPIEKYEFGSLGKAFTSGWNACLDEILKTDGMRKE